MGHDCRKCKEIWMLGLVGRRNILYPPVSQECNVISVIRNSWNPFLFELNICPRIFRWMCAISLVRTHHALLRLGYGCHQHLGIRLYVTIGALLELPKPAYCGHISNGGRRLCASPGSSTSYLDGCHCPACPSLPLVWEIFFIAFASPLCLYPLHLHVPPPRWVGLSLC